MTTYRRYGFALLTGLLVIVYTMTNAGRFHIIDEVSLFALTESLALRGAVDTNAIAWTQWVNSPGEVLGEFGPDGQVFSKKGPAPAILATPWYWLIRFVGQLDIQIGLLQGVLLWNGLITALTAALLWLTALRLGYDDHTGAALGLLFGLATIAWPYANHFFGEPLSAFSLLTTFYGLLAYRQSGRMRWMWLAGVGAAVALVTVTAHVLLIAILSLNWLWTEIAGRPDRPPLWRQPSKQRLSHFLLALTALTGPLLLATGFLLWYNRVRFGDPFITGYHFDSGEGFTTPFWQGFWGLMVSPYRGLFWHTPLLLATPIGLVLLWRRWRAETVLISALSVALVGLYSTWWMWWGGFAWGPRFLVPLTPFWILALAPMVASSVRPVCGPGRRFQFSIASLPLWKPTQALFWALVALSVTVQLLAVSANYVNYEIELRKIFPTDQRNPLAFGPPAQSLADWRYSPVLGQWTLLRTDLRANSDLAWLRDDGTVEWTIVIVGMGGLATLLIAGWSWWRLCADERVENLPSLAARIAPAFLALVVIATWLGTSSSDPRYGAPGEGYRALLDEICAEAQPGDALITVAPYAYHIPMNWMASRCAEAVPLFGYATDSMQYAQTQQVLGQVAQFYQRLWFVTGGLPPNDAENSIEHWLASVAYKADDRWFSDYRLVRYATSLALQNSQPVPLDMFLTGAQGEQVTIWAVRAPGVVSGGEIMPVELIYQLDTPVTGNLRWFVQLLTADDYAVALIDTAPAQGYAAFPAMPQDIQFVEKVALQLPKKLTPGRYRLIAGLYNPDAPNPNRLRTPTDRDHVDLGVIVVR
jgi:hypothetical protein